MYFTLPAIVSLFLIFLLFTFFIVKQQSAAIIERFGRFQSIRQSGLQINLPLIDRVAGRLSLKILDDVFVRLKISVQYKVVNDKV